LGNLPASLGFLVIAACLALRLLIMRYLYGINEISYDT
jgi:hypothetical protein